jgi:hypothetical protein
VGKENRALEIDAMKWEMQRYNSPEHFNGDEKTRVKAGYSVHSFVVMTHVYPQEVIVLWARDLTHREQDDYYG